MYESAKESLGKLLEWGGAGVGMLLGLAATRLGIPISPAVAAIGGTVAGGLIGSQAKAIVVTAIDLRREQREKSAQAAAAGSTATGETASPDRGSIRLTAATTGHSRRGSVRTAHGSSGGIAGQVISGIEQVLEQIEQTAGKLNAVAASMRNSQDSMMVLIYGGRADVVRRTHDAMSGARDSVYDSAVLLRGASEDLRAYRASI
ncbi:hypothetical protein OG792_23635 [Micromonospora sp. NBC_01699]|uniref:hypothetical protein n=1 Tax=Micromonospora sp. NBC_01699 TaxID=2975984 RepID=UPI002E290260|nr:hypothetical protein [Micromonospora sp. NBC_01699]